MKKQIWLGLKPEEITEDQWRRIERAAGQLGYELILESEAGEPKTADLSRVAIALGKFPRERILEAEQLEWLQQFHTGTDWLRNNPAVLKKDFILTNVSDVHYISLAEHAILGWLAWARWLPRAMESQRKRTWDRPTWSHDDIFELIGSTLLLAGVGSIGTHIAQIAKGFGVSVIGIRKNPQSSVPHVDEIYGTDQLLEILPRADAVINSLPHTPETRHFFAASAFQAMKPTAVFVNVGRGSTVDENALVQALNTRQIRAASLDVFEQEPLPPEAPIRGCDNVLITNHYAGFSPFLQRRAIAMAVENLEQYIQGHPLRNLVDKTRGY